MKIEVAAEGAGWAFSCVRGGLGFPTSAFRAAETIGACAKRDGLRSPWIGLQSSGAPIINDYSQKCKTLTEKASFRQALQPQFWIGAKSTAAALSSTTRRSLLRVNQHLDHSFSRTVKWFERLSENRTGRIDLDAADQRWLRSHGMASCRAGDEQVTSGD